MEAASVRVVVPARLDALVVAGLAAVTSALVVLLAPPGGDSAAHLYRTELVRDGVLLWDNLWFAGHYPLASYSPLYYLPAALFGNIPVVVASVIVAALLFGAISTHDWGETARWPARVFAVAAAGPLFTGTYSYALGVAFALGTLRLLQLGRRRLAVGTAALALAASPLAFAFLLLVLGAVVIARRPPRVAPLGIALAALACAQVAVLAFFPVDVRYPFSAVSLLGVVIVAPLAAALAWRAEHARVLAALFALWTLVCVAAFAVPSPFGDNLTRLRGIVFALVLLTAALARFRPWPLAVAALAAAFVYNVGPDVSAFPKRMDDRPTSTAKFWAPALDFLREHSRPDHRVEVVPMFGHWEAYYVPRAGFPLARGWYRQIDLSDNPELYERPLDAARYRTWLRERGVRFVLVPRAELGARGADREAGLVRSGRAGLRRVTTTSDWLIYELPRATPILTGPAPAQLTRLDSETIAGRVSAQGTYLLRVRYSPHRRVSGPVCQKRGRAGMTQLVARAPGTFVLEPAVRVGGPDC